MIGNRWIRITAALAVAGCAATGAVWACGPFFTTLETVAVLDPGDPDAFARGEVGVVRPRFRRRYLITAYRALAGRPPLKVAAAPDAPSSYDIYPLEGQWNKRRDQILKGPRVERPGRTRRLNDYADILNCLGGAFETAIKTLDARAQRFGADSPELRDWVKAQDDVFANCEEEPLWLPEPAAENADPLIKADRAYQIAAAYFYGMNYDEAARRFRLIADDASSPWRVYGRYLAARSSIRAAWVVNYSGKTREQRLADAERELQEVIADPVSAPLHDSARSLLPYVRMRLRPAEYLRAVSARLATATGDVAWSDADDFRFLMDQIVGDTVEFSYDGVKDAASVRDGNDLADWVMAMQGQGPQARDRATTRWQETRSESWLVAALWQADGTHPQAAALLDAAANVPAASPAYPTVAFLRVRLLDAGNRQDEARAVLAALPNEAGGNFSRESINFLRAERFKLARTLEEFLASASRTPAFDLNVPIFDEDAGKALGDRFPLDRLIDAAQSNTLPTRLRTRVATAAFTRAILLNRHDAARRVAPRLAALAPPLKADLDRYMSESTGEGRRRAAVYLILRTPGMTREVPGLENDYLAEATEPRREHESFMTTWWCKPYESSSAPAAGDAESQLIHMLYPTHNVPYPSFITADERTAADKERTAALATGHASYYLATATLEWARSSPADPRVPEALSRLIKGWRRACRDQKDSGLPKRAFQILHRQYAATEWAKATPYWYQ